MGVDRPSLDTLSECIDIVGAEIGVQRGINAKNILDNLNIKLLYLIDPYDVYPSVSGRSVACSSEEAFDIMCEAFKNLESYQNKIIWVREFSDNAIRLINRTLDFVYIDGDHSTEQVTKDINNYLPLLNKNGLLAGHDYDRNYVKVAVDKRIKNLKVAGCKDKTSLKDWWVYKNDI